MSEHDKSLEIATFRFGIISEFVTNINLSYGEKEHFFKEKVARSYKIPYTDRTSISRSTIISWIQGYKRAGYDIKGLYPKSRKDKGTYKTLDATLRLAIKEMKKENSRLTVPVMIRKLRQKKLLSMDQTINSRSIYTFLKREKLTSLNETAEDRRKFEASAPNEIWQSDVMHGPRSLVSGINRKTYLCAIIDDNSRMIMHAEFYKGETLDNLKNCLKQAIEKRGLPQKLYVDNGSCYRAINLDQITACLGIALQHARPYQPQGKGKIERWFRNVRDNFLPFYTNIQELMVLNEQFFNWVDEYNNREHSSIKSTPYNKYKNNLKCIRPAPKSLMDYFRVIDFRKVKMDRTFQLNSSLYEAPVKLIGKKIEVRYHEDDASQVEIYFDNRSFGVATPVDLHLNSKIGRSYRKSLGPKPKDYLEIPKTITSGQLFKGKNDE